MSSDETMGGIKVEISEGMGKHPLEETDSFEEHMRKDIGGDKEKTFKEKAKEKGYYKAEDGIWWQAYDDGWVDERREWFKLDEEYPDLADKTEKLAEKYHVEYGDYGGLKEYVYKNADSLNGASDEHLGNLFGIAGAISFSTSGTDELLVGYDSNKLKSICGSIVSLYSKVADLMPEHKLDEKIMKIGEYLVRNYNEKLVEGDFIESLAKYSAKAFLDDQKQEPLTYGIKCGIEGISKNEDSGRLFDYYMDYVDELAEDEKITITRSGNSLDDYHTYKKELDKKRITRQDTRSRLLCGYVQNHGIKEGMVSGFRNVIFPLLEQKDDEVKSIYEGGNVYGTSVGLYGVADYTEECLLSSYNPREIDKLIRIYHEIPTSDYKKFEQNRKDAARLQGTIIGGRDFIHDERPGVNEILVAIKDYYMNRDSDDSISYKFRLAELEDKYHFGVLPYAFNLEAYEKPIDFMGEGHSGAGGGSPEETALDILNRLIENTRPNLLEAPKTKDEELNRLMESISPTMNEQTGEVLVDFDRVGVAVEKMNEILLRNNRKQGIYPSMISAIAFLDKMSAYALRKAGKKDLQELPFDPGFKEMVRFSQLTSSMEYNKNDFENKYRQIVDKFSEAYGDDGIDSSKIAEGSRILNQQILKNVQGLSKNYASKSVTARFSDAVWSGNLSDELIGLFDKVQ